MNPDDLIRAARALAAAGLSPGSSGNISVRGEDRILITPTGSSLSRVTAAELATVSLDGAVLSGAPSKEFPLHLALYRQRPEARAVVHLHSPHTTAVSCVEMGDDPPLTPITPYHAMRFADLPVVPYSPPGSADLAAGVGEAARRSGSMLLANHGSVVSAPDLDVAVDLSEELESAAHIQLLLHGYRIRPLPEGEIDRLRR